MAREVYKCLFRRGEDIGSAHDKISKQHEKNTNFYFYDFGRHPAKTSRRRNKYTIKIQRFASIIKKKTYLGAPTAFETHFV